MEDKTVLHILWTTADVNTSLHMVLMYAMNSRLRSWWDEVTVVIWGASAKLVAENGIVQEKMKMAMQAGVKFSACIACANVFGVVERLRELDIEVIGWGQPLAELIQSGKKLLTV
jgi:hypothetical protein